MRKINKITNIALIFTLIGVFLFHDISYADDVSHLRVPVDGEYFSMQEVMSSQSGSAPDATVGNEEENDATRIPDYLKDEIAQFADAEKAQSDNYTTDELIVFARVALILSQEKGDYYWMIFKNIQEAIHARPNCIAFIHENSGKS